MSLGPSWINRYKVAKINALIEAQIVNRTEQLMLLAQLKRSIAKRMVQGELRREDIEYIASQLKQMQELHNG